MSKDNVDLICNVAELAGLFEKSSNLEDFLQSVVSTVAFHMNAAVCSIYLLDEEHHELVLRATQGLSHDAVGHLRLNQYEGIVGAALKEMRPIREARAAKSAWYKHIPGINEEQYQAFLAVPILKGLTRIGVLAVQDTQLDYFDGRDARALQAIATQLATTIENAQLFLSVYQQDKERKIEESPSHQPSTIIKGKSASEGFAFGRPTVISDRVATFSVDNMPEVSGKTEEDFNAAIEATERQITRLQDDMEKTQSDVSSLIFSAHLLILRDQSFSGSMTQKIREGVDVARAIERVVMSYTHIFSASKNPKLQEKVTDVIDVGHRILNNLAGRDEDAAEYQSEIIISPDMLPSDLVRLSAQGAEGLILIGGSVSSHISVLARSLQIPTVLIEDQQLLRLPKNTYLQLDGYQGTVIINPSEEIINNYQGLERAQHEAEKRQGTVHPETFTADGTRVRLLCAINLLSDLSVAKQAKAEGVGLYRSEFPFIVRNSFPSEEEQHHIYKQLVESMEGKEVIMRTLDVGGDKILSYFPMVNEMNPFLGLRAIRFSLKNRPIFESQLNAMLRAGVDHDVGIVFPLISSVDDFIQAKDVVLECIELLAGEGVAYNASPRLGVMVELPSAVAVGDELAKEADFLCIGSNDLIQYTLAVDRTNELISDFYLSHHPAVLRGLKSVVCSAAKHGTPVSLCGEMAHDQKMIPFLLGIGLRTLTLNAQFIPRVQAFIEKVNLEEAVQHAESMLAMGRVSEVNEYLDAMAT